MGGAKATRSYLDAKVIEIINHLSAIRDAVDAEDVRESTVRRVNTGATLEDGTLTLEIPGPRLGFSWKIKKVSIIVRGGVNSSAVLYVGAVSEGGMAHVFSDADFVAQSVDEVFVPSGSAWIEISKAPANAHVTVAVQAIEEKATPKGEQ